MSKSSRVTVACFALLSLLAVAAGARAETVITELVSYQEVPSISSAASGHFRAFIDDKAGTILTNCRMRA